MHDFVASHADVLRGSSRVPGLFTVPSLVLLLLLFLLLFFFFMLTYSDPLALKQLEGLYIGRTYHVWKEPEVRRAGTIIALTPLLKNKSLFQF